jgi:8-oxo-dGTP pyrophosphatase MutT (NUDIX family)
VSAIIIHNDSVLLIEHRKSGTHLPPGGHIDEGEDPIQALHREVREEVGIDVEILAEDRFNHPAVGVVPPPFTILVIDDVPDPVVGPHTHIDLVYVCRPATHDVIIQPDEVGGFKWVALTEIALTPTPPEIPDLMLAAAKYASQF